jgi:amino acid permease
MSVIVHRHVRFWRGLRPLLGSTLGVGFFGLPFACATVGWVMGIALLMTAVMVNTVLLFAYSQIALAQGPRSHGRYIHVVGEYFSGVGKLFIHIVFLALQAGTLLAYIIAGGTFLALLLQPLFGGGMAVYAAFFWGAASLSVLAGKRFVTSLQRYILPLFFVSLGVLAAIAFPAVRGEYLLHLSPQYIPGVAGVFLLACYSITAIPEVRDAVQGQERLMDKAIVWGMITVFAVYLLFTAVVVGVTGRATSPESLRGLMAYSPVLAYVAAAIGVVLVFNAFVNVGIAAKNTLVYDLRVRYLSSWGLVCCVPGALFLLGVRNFVGVLTFTGSVLASLCALFVLWAYERARTSHLLPKYILCLPQWAVFISGLAFFLVLSSLFI